MPNRKSLCVSQVNEKDIKGLERRKASQSCRIKVYIGYYLIKYINDVYQFELRCTHLPTIGDLLHSVSVQFDIYLNDAMLFYKKERIDCLNHDLSLDNVGVEQGSILCLHRQSTKMEPSSVKTEENS
ncbi:hypothetical protein ACOME3_003792 [Neoechinorhynchus agilis]